MKLLIVLTAFTLCQLVSSAQNVTGLFAGRLENDSTKKIQEYELALLDYRGKITGYSYTTFVVNDTFYYSIKEVRGTKNGNTLIVEDEKMLANNFPQRPDKGVHVINTIPLENVDTMRSMNGTWRTTQTKKFYSIHGAMALQRSPDSSQSPLIHHLQELNILPPLYNATYAATKTETTTIEPVKTSTSKTEVVKTKVKEDKEKEKQKIKTVTTVAAPVVAENIPYTQRASRPLQELTVESDSLVLSFYDNGVVDGDSITVYINGKNILSQQKLKESAVKRTIYLNEFNGEDLQLTLVADNLGSIPPNTGLLIVQDGANRYQVNFSADLQTNATLIMKRKKNGRN